MVKDEVLFYFDRSTNNLVIKKNKQNSTPQKHDDNNFTQGSTHSFLIKASFTSKDDGYQVQNC